MAGRLSDRDKIFADEYMLDMNAKNAALRAGFAPATANTAAAWIHEDHPTKPKLRELIDKKMAQRSRRTGITADRVLNELARIAFADPADIIDLQHGTFVSDAARADTAAIASVRFGKKGEIEIRMSEKTRALELIGKHLGMFDESMKVMNTTPEIIDDVGLELEEERKIGFATEDTGNGSADQ